MLKNFIKVVLVSVAVLSSFSAMSKDYVEGKDYKIVSQNKTVEPEVREFFSFFCTHCFSILSQTRLGSGIAVALA